MAFKPFTKGTDKKDDKKATAKKGASKKPVAKKGKQTMPAKKGC